jgi:hypothetical protein
MSLFYVWVHPLDWVFDLSQQDKMMTLLGKSILCQQVITEIEDTKSKWMLSKSEIPSICLYCYLAYVFQQSSKLTLV